MSSELQARKGFEDLVVWQKAVAFSVSVYQITQSFPKDERFGLTNQLRRASVSVASNIAEGSTRGTNEFIHFLNIARGSLAEIKTQLIIAEKIQYLNNTELQTLLSMVDELSRMTAGLRQSLTNRTANNLELATQN